MTRYLLSLLAVVFVSAAQAKCLPGAVALSIKQANGLIVRLVPTSYYTYAEVPELYAQGIFAQGILEEFADIYLGIGDTVLVNVGISECNTEGFLQRDGHLSYSPPGGLSTFKCTAPASYAGGNCDEGCHLLRFRIRPIAGATGPVSMSITTILDGALVSGATSVMRSDLPTAGLLPHTEPYTASGYTFVGGGGLETLGTPPTGQVISVVDWLVLELRSATNPAQVVASKAVLLDKFRRVLDAGTYANPTMNVPPGRYYVALRHRNHLGVMTASAISLMPAITTIDFTSTALPLYGTDAMKTNGSQRAMWAGNGRPSTTGAQQIKYIGPNNDRDAILGRVGGSVPTAMVNGYFTEDINLDGHVKYIGTGNDRDLVLGTVGGSVPTAMRTEQLP